ncbi:MAG TPA: L,D-transpeptidase family protein [Chloroflexota bacterium]|nr:L,D-transpeptidase family protein [Chloroflexota bacterium]
MRRISVCVAFLLGVLFLSIPAARADGLPAAPTGLAMSRVSSSATLASGSWINQTTLAVHFAVQVGAASLTPQVEIEPSNVPFTGTPTASGQPVTTSGTVTLQLSDLKNGQTYHWQARVVDAAGNASPWTTFTATSGPEIGIDTTPPSAPTLASSSNPVQGNWYHTRIETLRWHAVDTLSGVAVYAYHVGRRPQTPTGSGVASTGATISHLPDGIWVVTVRARDNAGNWGPSTSYVFRLDTHPAALTWLSPSRIDYNPYQGPMHLHFRVSKLADVTLELYRVGSRKPVASFRYAHALPGRVLTITWTGRTAAGKLASAGYYFFSAHAVDHAGNVTHAKLGGIAFNPARPTIGAGGVHLYPNGGKLIVVVLSQQTLYAYQGNRLVLQTYVTTGNRFLPTPVGNYQVLARYSPYEFISPWPQGSPYWYAPSWVHYALLFRVGGYFLHDAPWRSVFGPGSNSGTAPGTNYGGTHGCVNIPPGAMTFLWNWTPIGTPVDVVP